MTAFATRPAPPRPLDPARFRDPQTTLDGKRRARVAFTGLRTLWINTGTLCNITCANCYIESSPRNDSARHHLGGRGRGEAWTRRRRRPAAGDGSGSPAASPSSTATCRRCCADALGRGCRALVLTNAMKPMRRHEGALRALGQGIRRPPHAARQPRPPRRRTARSGAGRRQLRPRPSPGSGGWRGTGSASRSPAAPVSAPTAKRRSACGFAALFAAHGLSRRCRRPGRAGAVPGDGRRPRMSPKSAKPAGASWAKAPAT